MTDLTTYAGQRVPVLSSALETAISGSNVSFFGKRETPAEREARMKRGDPAPGMVISAGPRVPPSGAVIAEARRILPELERALDPMPDDRLQAEVDRFLDVLNASVVNSQDLDALELRKSALTIALEGCPAIVWTHATLRLAQRRFRFFPSVAELAELIDEVAAPLRDRVAQVRVVSRQEPREPERPRPSEAERQAVAAQMAALRAEVAEREAHEARIRQHGNYTPPGAEGLTGWALLDALRADLPNLEGDLLAVTRERVEEMQRRFEMAQRVMTSEAHTSC